MANNRMYLKNTRTGERFYLAKYYPSTGWYSTLEKAALDAWFDSQDFGQHTAEQIAANAKVPGLGVPYPSAGGMFGAEYAVELEEDGD